MRQLLVHVPRGEGRAVLEFAGKHDATNFALLEADGGEGPLDVVVLHVSNEAVEGLLEDLQQLPDLRVSFFPRGVVTLKPPREQAPDQVTDVGHRSPVEVFLSSLQSIGSWKGFLGYAAAAGVVAWVGLFTNTSYLLVAAMLIAPFAGPAMNFAIGTARGDVSLLKSSVLRYFAALLTTSSVCALLSLVFRQEVETSQMVDASQISSTALLLPLAAGAAGAVNLVQSERSSLVSGAAVGMLVAASLAPPAGIIGMASAIGEWGMVASGLFLLLLQLVGINLAGALVFRAFGLKARGVRYERGKRRLFPVALAVTLAALAALLAWQFSSSPEFRRTTRAQRATAAIHEVVAESGLGKLVEADVRFTRANIPGQNTLLGVIYVQRDGAAPLGREEIRERLTRAIESRLLSEEANVTPLANVVVLDAPSPPHAP